MTIIISLQKVMRCTSKHPLLTRHCETGNYHFADPKGFNDCLTSSSLTLCRSDFRSDIFRRDGGRCVITAYDGDECDAAHIIPLSKGDEVLF